jgi:hypothetical protein
MAPWLSRFPKRSTERSDISLNTVVCLGATITLRHVSRPLKPQHLAKAHRKSLRSLAQRGTTGNQAAAVWGLSVWSQPGDSGSNIRSITVGNSRGGPVRSAIALRLPRARHSANPIGLFRLGFVSGLPHGTIKEGGLAAPFFIFGAALTLRALIFTNNLDYRHVGLASDAAICLLQTDEDHTVNVVPSVRYNVA